MQWNQCQDTFQFLCNLDTESYVVSKRVILSEVARLFDPLGLLGPVIVIAKLILQDLWQLAIQWNESVPQDIHTRWIAFRTQMSNSNQLKIPRVKFNVHQPIVEVHGFCDASQCSELAYTFAPSSVSTTITPSCCAQSLASHRSKPFRYRD